MRVAQRVFRDAIATRFLSVASAFSGSGALAHFHDLLNVAHPSLDVRPAPFDPLPPLHDAAGLDKLLTGYQALTLKAASELLHFASEPFYLIEARIDRRGEGFGSGDVSDLSPRLDRLDIRRRDRFHDVRVQRFVARNYCYASVFHGLPLPFDTRRCASVDRDDRDFFLWRRARL
jgi:hypothetical protein